jgi:autotransporter-associated beta strand protein
MKAHSFTPAFAALILAAPVSVARADAISQSKVTLALTFSQTAPSLAPRTATGSSLSGARVDSNQYTDRRGNTILEKGSAIVRTRFGNRELLTTLKTLGIITDIAGYSVIRENNADITGTYYLHKKLSGGQIQRIDITPYMVDSLPLMKNPVSSETGRNQSNASGVQTSFAHQVTAAGVGGVEFRGLFPAVASDGSTGAMVLEGPASTKETYVTGKGYTFSAGFPTLSGGYTRVVRASGEAPGMDDHVYAEGSLTIATSTFKPAAAPTTGQVNSGTVTVNSGSLNLSGGGLQISGPGGLDFAGGVLIPGNSPGTIVTGGMTGAILHVTGQLSQSAVNLNAADLVNTAGIIKSGSGTLVLQGASTYTGNISISDGSLILQDASTYAGTITLGGGTLNAASLAIPTGGGLILNGSTGTYTITDASGTRLSPGAQ